MVAPAPTAEHLLVFYFPRCGDVAGRPWRGSKRPATPPCRPHNPYWNALGRTFQDPDGYHVVLQQAAWEL